MSDIPPKTFRNIWTTTHVKISTLKCMLLTLAHLSLTHVVCFYLISLFFAFRVYISSYLLSEICVYDIGVGQFQVSGLEAAAVCLVIMLANFESFVGSNST